MRLVRDLRRREKEAAARGKTVYISLDDSETVVETFCTEMGFANWMQSRGMHNLVSGDGTAVGSYLRLTQGSTPAKWGTRSMAQKVLSSIINTVRWHSRRLTTAVITTTFRLITTTFRLVVFIPLTLSVACCLFVRLRAALILNPVTFDENIYCALPAGIVLRYGPYQCCHLQQAQVGQ
jgi:hypothetical protein